MLFSRFLAVSLFLSQSLFFVTSSALAQVNIVQAPANYEFVDMGYDATTDKVGIVGNVVNGTDRTATVFELNAAGDGFTAQTLADLPGATQNATVSAISSDAHRIAGSSTSTTSVDFEGVTWLRSNPNNATGIGFLQGQPNRSGATGAWRDGVVGEAVGSSRPIKWSQSDGIQELSPSLAPSISLAQDASSNAEVIVGFSSHEVLNGAAYYWDSLGINRLDDNINGHTLFQSIAKSISPNGNYIGGEITAIDNLGGFRVLPAIWEGAEKTLRILTDSNGNLLSGTVNDVSNLGYVVGSFFDASFNSFGFIWNPEFTNGVRLFEDWLEEESPGANFPFDSLSVDSIGSGNGRLFFTVAGGIGENALVEMVFDLELGDVNQDGDVNFGEDFSDIPAFIQVLIGQ